MSLYRKENHPNYPRSLRELTETIGEFNKVRGFYKGSVESEDGGVAMLFAHDEMIECINEASLLLLDGVRKVGFFTQFL